MLLFHLKITSKVLTKVRNRLIDTHLKYFRKPPIKDLIKSCIVFRMASEKKHNEMTLKAKYKALQA